MNGEYPILPTYAVPPQLPTAPPAPNFEDPVFRAAAEKQAIAVTEATAAFATIARVAPHPVIKYPALFLSGFAATDQAKIKPTPNIAMNAAPKPIGYTDPALFGLKPNFYLPSGVTVYLPRFADRAGLGLPEQRAEDLNRLMLASQRRAELFTQSETTQTLKALAGADAVPFLSRASVVLATSEASRVDLRTAAQRELLRRGVPVADVPNLPADFLAALAAATAPGSSRPGLVDPPNDAAKRNLAAAEGIRKELAHERADP